MANFPFDPEKDTLKEDTLRSWVRKRVAAIHERLEAADVLQSNGVRLRFGGTQPEQISCPFHGTDRKPSARYHPASATSSSGVWCFVCNERWDAITLWGKFAQHEGTFTALLRRIENELGLDVPEIPLDLVGAVEIPTDTRLTQQLTAIENRLVASKRSFDLPTYLKVGSVLDRLWVLSESGRVTFVEAQPVLEKVLAKIRTQCQDA